MYGSPTLTFPLGPRRDRRTRFWLGGWLGRLLGLLLTRSLLNSSPSWASRFGRRGRRGLRRSRISGRSRWSSARWPRTAILSGVGFPTEGAVSEHDQWSWEGGTHQEGSNSPVGPYLARKVSKVPSSLRSGQNDVRNAGGWNSQLNVPLFLSELSNFIQEHPDLVCKRLAEFIEILLVV